MNCSFKPAVIVLLGVFLMLVLVSSGYGGTQDEKSPKMYIHETDVNLGEFYEGIDIRHTFVLRNNGSENLEIKVRPG